jgi:hypothetical protein
MAPAKFEYTIIAFADLCRAFPVWSDLRAFLESVEGGSLRVIDGEVEGRVIITYQRTVEENGKKVKVIPDAELFEKMVWLKWFQWTTWDTVANLPLAVAPQRSRPVAAAEKDKPMSEILVGAFVCPYQEGRVETTFELCESDQPVADPRKIHSLYKHTLRTGGEYVVVSRGVESGRRVLAEGCVNTDGTIIVNSFVDTLDLNVADELDAEMMPMTDSLTKFFSKYLAQQDLLYPGWIIHDGRGGQSVMLAGFYEQARAMRLLSDYAPYRLLELRRRGDLADYLRIFPDDQVAYDDLKVKIHRVTTELLDFYLERWQKKSKGWADIPKQYHKHIAAVNNIYHTELKPKRWVVREKNVIQYINDLPAAQLLFLVNRLDGNNATA